MSWVTLGEGVTLTLDKGVKKLTPLYGVKFTQFNDTLIWCHRNTPFFTVYTCKHDAVQEILQLSFKSFVLTIERLLIDHLPGGEFHNVQDPAVISETLSVPKTNVDPETNLDRMLLQKPNARYIALESMILLSPLSQTKCKLFVNFHNLNLNANSGASLDL